MSRQGILLVVVGLLIVAVGAMVIIQQRGERRLDVAMERFETEIGTLDPRVHAPPEVADEINAVYWFKQGADALSTLSDGERLALNELWEREGDPGPDVEALLERHAVAIEHLRRAGKLRASSWGIRYDAGPDVPLPDLLPHLWAKKILAADARAALSIGDRERVLADATAVVTLRRALEREPLLLFQLIAMSVELAYHELIQQALLSELADASMLVALAEQLDIGTAGRSLRASFAVEVARLIHSVDAVVADASDPWQRLRNVPVRVWVPMEYASAVDLYYRLGKATELPVGEIRPSLNPSPTPGMKIIAQSLVPNIVDAIEKSRASAAVRRLAEVAIAARLHALEHGTYPASLESFASASLADPYSGGTLHYETRSDGSAVVSFPDSASLWQQKNVHATHSRPRFVWRLPRMPSEFS